MISYVLNMDLVLTVSVSVMNLLDTKESFVKSQDVQGGLKIAVVMVHVT